MSASHSKKRDASCENELTRTKQHLQQVTKKNQDLEDMLLYTTKELQKEKENSRSIVLTLTERLMESREIINKLEIENMRLKKDCILAVELLQCNKSLDQEKFTSTVEKLSVYFTQPDLNRGAAHQTNCSSKAVERQPASEVHQTTQPRGTNFPAPLPQLNTPPSKEDKCHENMTSLQEMTSANDVTQDDESERLVGSECSAKVGTLLSSSKGLVEKLHEGKHSPKRWRQKQSGEREGVPLMSKDTQSHPRKEDGSSKGKTITKDEKLVCKSNKEKLVGKNLAEEHNLDSAEGEHGLDTRGGISNSEKSSLVENGRNEEVKIEEAKLANSSVNRNPKGTKDDEPLLVNNGHSSNELSTEVPLSKDAKAASGEISVTNQSWDDQSTTQVNSGANRMENETLLTKESKMEEKSQESDEMTHRSHDDARTVADKSQSTLRNDMTSKRGKLSTDGTSQEIGGKQFVDKQTAESTRLTDEDSLSDNNNTQKGKEAEDDSFIAEDTPLV